MNANFWETEGLYAFVLATMVLVVLVAALGILAICYFGLRGAYRWLALQREEWGYQRLRRRRLG